MCNSKNFGDKQEIHILSCKSRIFKPGVGQWTSFAEFLQCLSDQHISRDRIQYTILISNIDQWDQVRTYPQSRLELRPVCILLAIAIRIYTIWRVGSLMSVQHWTRTCRESKVGDILPLQKNPLVDSGKLTQGQWILLRGS